MAAEAMMGHSLTAFGVESIYNYSISRLDYLRGEYLKALNSLLFLKEPRGMEIINGVARQRIEELEGRLAALEDAVKFYEALLKHIERKNPKLFRELGLG
jgi:rubrerythrin